MEAEEYKEIILEDIKKTGKLLGQNTEHIVNIPFKVNNVTLGNSKPRAMAQLLQLKKRLPTNPDVQKACTGFMNEYLSLGHMQMVKTIDENKGKYHIPHQLVIREDSTTTKLRVVFDA